MNIIGFFNISNTNDKLFNRDLEDAVNKLQANGQKVEVQYKVNTFPNGQLCYSALVLGRK